MSHSILKDYLVRAKSEEDTKTLEVPVADEGQFLRDSSLLPTSNSVRRENTKRGSGMGDSIDGDGNVIFDPISRLISALLPLLPDPMTPRDPTSTMASWQSSQESYGSVTQTSENPGPTTETETWVGSRTDTWERTSTETETGPETRSEMPQKTATTSAQASTITDDSPDHSRTLSIPTYDFPPSTMTRASTDFSTTSSKFSSTTTESNLGLSTAATETQYSSQSSTVRIPTDVAGFGPPDKDSRTPAGLVVGSIVGGVVGAALIVGIIFWFCRNRAKNHKNDIRTPNVDTRSPRTNEKSQNIGHTAFVTTNRSAKLSGAAEHHVDKLERKWRASAIGGKLGVEPSPTSSRFMQYIQNNNRSNSSVAGIAPSASSLRRSPEVEGSINGSVDEKEVYHTTSWILGKRQSNRSPQESLNSVGLGLHKSKESNASLSTTESNRNPGRSLTSNQPQPMAPATSLAPPGDSQYGVSQHGSGATGDGSGGYLSPPQNRRAPDGRSERFDLEMARRAEEDRRKRMTDELVSRPSTLSSNHSSIRSPMTVSSMGDWNDVTAAISYSNRFSHGRR